MDLLWQTEVGSHLSGGMGYGSGRWSRWCSDCQWYQGGNRHRAQAGIRHSSCESGTRRLCYQSSYRPSSSQLHCRGIHSLGWNSTWKRWRILGDFHQRGKGRQVCLCSATRPRSGRERWVWCQAIHLRSGKEKLACCSARILQRGKVKQDADQVRFHRNGMGKQAFDQGVVLPRGMGTQVAGLGAGRLRGKEKLVAGQGGRLHSGKGKRAFVQGAAPLHDTVRRVFGGGDPGRNTATPYQLQTGIGIGPVYHAHGPREVLAPQPVHVCGVPSRDGRPPSLPSRDGRPPSLRVCGACPPHVAYRVVLRQHHNKCEQDDNEPFSVTVTIRAACPGLLEFLKKNKKDVIDRPMKCKRADRRNLSLRCWLGPRLKGGSGWLLQEPIGCRSPHRLESDNCVWDDEVSEKRRTLIADKITLQGRLFGRNRRSRAADMK